MVFQKSAKIIASVLRGEIDSFCWFLDLKDGVGLIMLLKGGTKLMDLLRLNIEALAF